MERIKTTFVCWLIVVLATNVIRITLSFQIKTSFCTQTSVVHSRNVLISSQKYLQRLYSANDNNMNNDEDFRNRVRLKEEVASPFRKLRYFIYFSIIGTNFVFTSYVLVLCIIFMLFYIYNNIVNLFMNLCIVCL